MAIQLRPLDSKYLSVPRANVLMGDVGSNVYEDVGDVDGFTLSIEKEEIERFGKNFSTKSRRRSDVTQVNATIKMTLMDFTKFFRAVSVGGNTETVVTQASATGQSFSATGVKVGSIYQLPHMSVSNVVVTDGAATPVSYVEGTHYVVLGETGLIQIVAKPASSDADIEITYDADAIVAADDMIKAGLGSDFNVHKSLKIVGIGAIGPRDMLVLHDVTLSMDGERALVGEDDYAQLSITGKVNVDPSKEGGFQLGHLITLT